jgi:mRNA interferase RelE/StbE
LKASADKSLDKLPKSIQARAIEKATALGGNPRPPGAVKLTGASGLWRIRIGDYRMVYLIDDHGRSWTSESWHTAAKSIAGFETSSVFDESQPLLSIAENPGRFLFGIFFFGWVK